MFLSMYASIAPRQRRWLETRRVVRRLAIGRLAPRLEQGDQVTQARNGQVSGKALQCSDLGASGVSGNDARFSVLDDQAPRRIDLEASSGLDVALRIWLPPADI